MYEGIRVQLVDGGVQDNQGVQGLLDKSCTHVIVSDASGQMEDRPKPSTRIPGVLGRSASIEGDRIRDEQLIGTLARPSGRYALMHLRKGLDAKQVAPVDSLRDGGPVGRGDCSTDDFDVDADVQRALSCVRTDLDYFSDAEAFSLALDGYLMSSFELERQGLAALGDGAAAPRDPARWAFGKDAALAGEVRTGGRGLLRRLEVGKRSFFRLFALAPGVAVMIAILATVGLALGIGSAWDGIAAALEGQWAIYPVLGASLAAILLLAGYATDPRWPPIRLPIEAALALLMAAAAPLLWIWANLSVLATKLYR
jgi:NTE family protein